MRPSTVTLHRQIIRLCKGILKAWEQWIKETEEDQHLEWKSSATKDDFTVKS